MRQRPLLLRVGSGYLCVSVNGQRRPLYERQCEIPIPDAASVTLYGARWWQIAQFTLAREGRRRVIRRSTAPGVYVYDNGRYTHVPPASQVFQGSCFPCCWW